MAFFGNDIIKTTIAGSEYTLTGIVDVSLQRNAQVNQADIGASYAGQATLGFKQKVYNMTTEAFLTVVDDIQLQTLNGVCYATNITDGLTVYQLRHARCEGNGRDQNPTHWSEISALGHLLTESITANAGGHVQTRFMAHPLSSDGQTNPIVRAFNTAIPTDSPINTKFRMANPVINGSYISGLESVSINYNHRFAKPIGGEDNYPREFDWQQCGPVVSMTFNDPEKILASPLTIGENGLRLSSATSKLQFQASSSTDGGWTNPASAVHITCGLNGLLHVTTPHSASGPASSRITVEVITTETAVGLPLVWITDASLTTS